MPLTWKQTEQFEEELMEKYGTTDELKIAKHFPDEMNENMTRYGFDYEGAADMVYQALIDNFIDEHGLREE